MRKPTLTSLASPVQPVVLSVEQLPVVDGGADHCGQDNPIRALGCEVGYHLNEFLTWLTE